MHYFVYPSLPYPSPRACRPTSAHALPRRALMVSPPPPTTPCPPHAHIHARDMPNKHLHRIFIESSSLLHHPITLAWYAVDTHDRGGHHVDSR